MRGFIHAWFFSCAAALMCSAIRNGASMVARHGWLIPATGIAISLGTGSALPEPVAPLADRDAMLFVETDNFTLRASLAATSAGIGYAGTWFGLARSTLGTNFDPQRLWGEG